MSLVLQSSGGGSVTLEEPVTASNLTITVPAVSGTMITTASTGTVLQVVNATNSATETSTSSSSFVNQGALSATITPKFSTSKIVILITTTSTGTAVQYSTIARNTTELSGNNNGMVRSSVPSNYVVPTALSWVDSPATTSATTYYLQGRVSGGTGYWGGPYSSITLLEIAA
jgi:hypothetical protein